MTTAATSARPFVPESADLNELGAAVQGCRGCELYRDATQAVFGRGSATASLMLVGEQPGDSEDKEGEPFVGPSGKLLDKALAEIGLARSTVYVTNAVKHFRFTVEGPGARRLHAKPSTRHIEACKPWLEEEMLRVAPKVVVALGASAARALLGSRFRLMRERGQLLSWPPSSGPFAESEVPVEHILATVHPSAVLRSPTPADREQAFAGLVADLRIAAQQVQ